MQSPSRPATALALLLSWALVLGVNAAPVSAEVTVGRSGASAKLPPSPNGRYLVQYDAAADLEKETRSLRARGLEARASKVRSFKAAVVEATRDEAASLGGDPDVVAVEPDMRLTSSATQDGAPWGLDRIDQRGLPLSRTYTPPAPGTGVDVYVMDTGVLAGHRDFGGRVAPGWSAINDGLGSGDCNGHGTHVAGTVAGSTYGVAKGATIVPVRVLGCDGAGWGSDLVEGLEWIAGHHAAGDPAVLNMSLGGDAASSVIDSAVRAVISDGVTSVVAAGNAAKDACTTSPARVSEAVTIAATDENDRQASFSNFGTCVDMYAPGVRIVSASHLTVTGTASFSGTSMAAPHAAGAAAVLLSQRVDLDPTAAAAELSRTATAGVVVNASSGSPNRLLLVTAAEPTLAPAPEPAPAEPTAPAPAESVPPAPAESAAPAPAESAPEDSSEPSPETEPNPEAEPTITRPERPTDVTATPRRRAARVTWRQGDDGGAPLTGQVIRVYRGTTRVATLKAPADVAAARVVGLRPGKTYRFTVIAKNGLGKSPESRRSNKVIPRR